MFEENYPETLKHLFVVKGKLGISGDRAKYEQEAGTIAWGQPLTLACTDALRLPERVSHLAP